ncbi:S8 family serine peptidase [Nocardioides albus]|uniref:Subtilisin family serine protease n=1 Tax=Nocardioides albus TaxID=1841 RepID=A0A7W5F9F2_9ACTN|nr:S8 family serine peptidase [Nocardioides albus]MBB3090143.1 subtilisin family serine protease [Nocardioides albus]GGU27978.1 hypothetical protein GCM10007979_28510 [Nocardioides albus]
MSTRLNSRRFRVIAALATTMAMFGGLLLTAPTAAAVPVAGPVGSGAATVVPAAERPAKDPADKIEKKLAKQLEKGTDDFLVRFEDAADLTGASQNTDWAERGKAVADALRAQAEESQAETRAVLRKRGVTYRAFWATNAILVKSGSSRLAHTLAAEPDVEGLYVPRAYAAPEPIETKSVVPQSTAAAVEWGIADIHADQVWSEYGVNGQGMVVANIDSGVQYDHPALVSSYRGNNGDGTFDHDYNWMDVAGADCAGPCDSDGHGTHTMGTMVGDDAGGTGIGVAPGATWIAVNGCCPSDTALIAAGEWILEPTDRNGENPNAAKRPNVVNNSWGSQAPSNDPFMEDISKAWEASGIFSSFANGNNGPGCATSGAPGSRTVNYSVGAYAVNHTIGSFSSRGPGQDGEIKPAIAAPGVAIRSSVPGNGYDVFNGTSMAAPHLAGAVALLWSAAPVLVGDIPATQRLLNETAIDTEDLTCGGTPADNNVWGEGRLDVAALFARAPLGEAGFLGGTVTDAGGDPIAGATVTAEGSFTTSRDTAADGSFRMALPVGSYTVKVSAFGYTTQEKAGVEIAVGKSTSHDAELAKAPTQRVAGKVADGSGHGWPLYAKVSVPGTPVTTFTDPATGEYAVELPTGAAYDLTASPVDSGYQPASTTLDPAGTNGPVDLVAKVDPTDCADAPGYVKAQPRIAVVTDLPEQFRARFDQRRIAVDMVRPGQIAGITGYDIVVWGYSYTDPRQAAFTSFLTRMDAEGTGVVFTDSQKGTWGGVTTLAKYAGVPTSTGGAEAAAGETGYLEAVAEHPVLAGVKVGERWDHEPGLPAWMKWFNGYDGDGRQVLATVGSSTAGSRGAAIAVQQRATSRYVLLAMHSPYYTRDTDDWSETSELVFENALDWANAEDENVGCHPAPGGLVVGQVSDGNTGAGLPGARISAGSVTSTSVTTPADPALDDGLVRFFAPAGDREVTATLAEYQTATDALSVVADEVVETELELAAGRLKVSTGQIAATVPIGAKAERTVTVENTGSAPATVRLAERDRGGDLAVPEGYQAPQAAMTDLGTTRTQRAEVTPLQDVGPLDDAAPRSSRAPAGTLAEGWQSQAAMPQGTVDSVAGTLGNRLYNFGGTLGAGPVATSWMLDPDLGWRRIADMPQARQRPAGAFVDGRFVMLGGWAAGGDPVARTQLYDPGTDTWSRGAEHPVPLAAAGTAVLDGRILTVGGCASSCDHSEVFAYDAGADSFERLADYPVKAGWLNCGAIRGKVYCAGGSNGASAVRAAYVYDPVKNAWSALTPMPVAHWGSGVAAQGGRLLVSGGIAGASITTAGWAYDPQTDAWTALPNAPTPVYRGASACGFYTLGGSPNGTSVSTQVSLLSGQGDCLGAASDVRWMALSPGEITLAPGEQAEVTLALDGAAIAQPGEVRASLRLLEDTPYPTAGVEVTVTSPVPSTWGAVVGTIKGDSCNGETGPLTGATVQVDAGVRWTGLTGDDGAYLRWVDTAHNPVRVSALRDGWTAASSEVKVRNKGRATIVDLTLEQRC